MKDHRQSVAIRSLPERLDKSQQWALYRELEDCINIDRPSVVLDCSRLRQLDGSAAHFLLCCLEEAIKRNGDIRLAALGPETKRQFRSTGLADLFQTFDSTDEAEESFREPLISLGRQVPSIVNRQRAKENAA